MPQPIALLALALSAAPARAADTPAGAPPAAPPSAVEEEPASAPPAPATEGAPPPDGAAPEAPAAEDDETIAEIVVFGELEIARRRRALNNRLRAQGYKEKKKKKDGTAVWRPETAWKPSVEVHEEGFVVMKRSPVRFESYVKGTSPARWIACTPPFIVMCVRIGGQVVSKARLDAQKSRVATSMDAELDAWTAAVTATSMKERIEVQLPAALDETWRTGAPFEGSGPLPTPADRRQAFLDFWGSRACTNEGALVRRAVSDFLAYEVQESAHPVTEAERSAANAAATCGARLDFGPSPAPAPAAPATPSPAEKAPAEAAPLLDEGPVGP